MFAPVSTPKPPHALKARKAISDPLQIQKPTDQRPNILFITADDMNWDAVGAYGCPVEGTTPNIDRLASEGICFEHAHVTVSVCQPSRTALLTGHYPHMIGAGGFTTPSVAGVPILPELLREGGYKVGILGKVGHSTPHALFTWDKVLDQKDLGQGRNPARYAECAAAFFREAKEANQPFFLMLNSHDPHRPFFGNDNPDWYNEQSGAAATPPSRTFTPSEIQVPGFLPDLPDVRLEISEYYSSVRRCDDTVGGALQRLRDEGLEDNTLVVFLSDNGMAFPFAKTNCYLNSTRTPWILRWPGVIQPGSREKNHLISGIDLTPTLLEAAGLKTPAGIDGRSFLPLLRGESQKNRDIVFTQFHQTHGKKDFPMRCVQTRTFGYIFNAWSDGVLEFRNESQAGRTMNAMREAAAHDPAIADRVNLFLHRVPEEFYDLENDPNALYNLVDSPKHAATLQTFRQKLADWMEATHDPVLPVFRGLFQN